MTAEPAPAAELVVTLDQIRTVPLASIPVEAIWDVVPRILSPDHREATVEVASFSSSI